MQHYATTQNSQHMTGGTAQTEARRQIFPLTPDEVRALLRMGVMPLRRPPARRDEAE